MTSTKVAVLIGFCLIIFSGTSFAFEHNDLRSEVEELKKQIGDIDILKAKTAELEAKLAQYDREEDEHASEHVHHHDENMNLDIGHKHVHLDIHDIQVRGGLDWRYLDVEGAKDKMFLHEAEIGVDAHLTDWIEVFIAFTKHHGEEAEIEQAWGKLRMNEANLQTKIGKFFVNFGPENRAGFFDRRTITPSAMREGFFGEENWKDEGIEISCGLPFGTKSVLTIAALNGNNVVSFGDGESEIDNDNFPVIANFSSIIDIDCGKIDLGSSAAYGKWDEENERDIYLLGFDAGLTVGNWNFQGEYMYRDKKQPDGMDDQKGYGYYLLGSHTWPIKRKYLDSVELLFAFGGSDPDTGSKEIRYTPQLTFNLTEAAKIRFSYDIREEDPDNIDNNRFIIQFAYHF